VQPIDEQSCYAFSDSVLDMAEELKCSEIVTLGGIALKQVPKEPQIFLTGNSKPLVKKYQQSLKLNTDIYGVVGPIVGVSGVLVGLAGRRKISAVSLLAETYGHPLYLGIAGARALMKALDKKLALKLNIRKLDKELSELEQEISDNPEAGAITRRSLAKLRKGRDTSYIG
jgi:proteasome assembly chaperone (PAC2) family protein